MLRVRLRVAALPRERVITVALVVGAALCLGLGLPRIALVPAFGVTWNVVPGTLLLALAGLLYGKEWQRDAGDEPVVGYWALLLLLPAGVTALAYANLVKHWLVGHDLTMIAQVSRGEASAGLALRLVLGLFGPSVPALLAACVTVHGLNAILVGLLGLRLSHDRAVGLLSGTLFAAYPLTVEAVGWLSAETLLEGAFYSFLAVVLAAWAQSERPRPAIPASDPSRESALRRGRANLLLDARMKVLASLAMFVSLLLTVMALAHTPAAIAVPLALAAVGMADRGAFDGRVGLRSAARAVARDVAAHVAVVAAFMVLRFGFDAVPPYEEPATSASLLELLANLVTFPRDLLIPLSPAYYDNQPLIIFVGVVLMTMVLVLALVRERADRGSLLGPLAVMVAFALPVLPYLSYDEGASGTRFLYLAGAGYVILGSVYLRVALRVERASRGWLLVVLAMAVSVGSMRNNLRLWKQTSRTSFYIVETLGRISETMPPGASIVLEGWPGMVDGVPFVSPVDVEWSIAMRRHLLEEPEVRVVTESPDPPGPGSRTFRWNAAVDWIEEVVPPAPPEPIAGS